MLSASLNPQPPAALEREPADLSGKTVRAGRPHTPIGHTGPCLPVLLPQVPSSSLACWRGAPPLP